VRKLLAAFVVVAATAAIAGGAVSSAKADYGPGTQYQVEISANSVQGGSFWFWGALGPGQESDYQNTDCIHSSAGGNPHSGPNGAAHTSGSLIGWSEHDGLIEMDGVSIIGGLATANFFILDQPHSSWFQIQVTSDPFHILPASTLTWQGGGTQVQVAP
jgi:hypothetical protein